MDIAALEEEERFFRRKQAFRIAHDYMNEVHQDKGHQVSSSAHAAGEISGRSVKRLAPADLNDSRINQIYATAPKQDAIQAGYVNPVMKN